MPPPRLNLIRYHGVLAPNARDRHHIVPDASLTGWHPSRPLSTPLRRARIAFHGPHSSPEFPTSTFPFVPHAEGACASSQRSPRRPLYAATSKASGYRLTRRRLPHLDPRLKESSSCCWQHPTIEAGFTRTSTPLEHHGHLRSKLGPRPCNSPLSAPFDLPRPIHRFSVRAGPGQHIRHRSAPKLPQDKPEIKLEILAHILSDNPFFAAYFAAYTVSLFR